MSAGHHHREHDLEPAELDDLLAEALANRKVKARLAKPWNLSIAYDIPLLGSSAIGGGTVYLDRHLRNNGGGPFGILPLEGRAIDVKPPLIRHERLEQAIEDELGWPYKLAHPVAQHWEEKLVKAKGFDPKAYERMLEPYI